MANVRTESKPKAEVARYAHGSINRASSIKTVYVQDNEFWEQAKDFAADNDLSLSEMIMQSLAEFMGKDKNHCGKCARIAEILSAGSMRVKKGK
jgi:hypothetical protein